jgi:hypothetical protein
MPDSWSYSKDTALRWAALLIFTLAYVAGFLYAVFQTVQGFVSGVLEARERHLARQEEAQASAAAGETPFPDRPRPAARPRPSRNYTVDLQDDNEVTLNGLHIGHIDASPWQFCSYDLEYGNGPARATKKQAWEDACDYAESVVRSA